MNRFVLVSLILAPEYAAKKEEVNRNAFEVSGGKVPASGSR